MSVGEENEERKSIVTTKVNKGRIRDRRAKKPGLLKLDGEECKLSPQERDLTTEKMHGGVCSKKDLTQEPMSVGENECLVGGRGSSGESKV